LGGFCDDFGASGAEKKQPWRLRRRVPKFFRMAGEPYLLKSQRLGFRGRRAI
jgi:hypothetical protein